MVQTVCRTKEIPMLLDKVIDVPVVQVVQLPGCGPDVQNTVAIPTGAVLGHGVHARSWCVWCRLSDSAETVEVPQLQFIAGRRLPFRAAETALHGPAFSEDHRDSSVAVCCLVVDAPVVHVVLDMPLCATTRWVWLR